MVSPVNTKQQQPDTLPADFDGWDDNARSVAEQEINEAVPGTTGSASVPAKAAKPETVAPSTETEPLKIVPESQPVKSASEVKTPSVSEVKEPIKSTTESKSRGSVSVYAPEKSTESEPEENASKEDSPRLSQEESDYLDSIYGVKPYHRKVKKKTIAVLAAVVLVLLLSVPSLIKYFQYWRHSNATPAQPAAKAQRVATNQTPVKIEEPRGVEQATNGSVAKNGEPVDAATAAVAPETTPQPVHEVHVQSRLMNEQLSAPGRISADLNSRLQNASSESKFSSANMAGLSSSSNETINAAFGASAGSKPKLATPSKVVISAGVASGMLIRRTDPIYPAIAKSARVSGTVVLHAVISRTGRIKDLSVISGPRMLQQAALNAVENWRYRPYMLNNKPVNVETTVNVIFVLND